MKVSVSILSSYENLKEAINKVNTTSADFLHIDVMDGKFVSSVKFDYEKCIKINKLSNKKIDMHLMVNDTNTIMKYASLNPDILTFHVEVIKNNSIIKYVKSLGIKVGLAINPETRVEKLIPYLKDIDLVLFMSVNPGLGGQGFKKSVLSKISKIKKIIPKNVIINIDGGINDKTINYVKEVGCNMVVSGSYITNSDDYEKKILSLK